jgi:alkylhydroperoxidase family enzyme
MARLEPLATSDWPPAMRQAMAVLRPANARYPYLGGPDRPKALNALGVLARHPELAQAFNTFNGHLLYTTTLTPRQRELLVLRVAAVRDAEYEWRQHAVLAGDAGLDEREVAAIAEGPDAPGWGPLDRAMLQAVDSLLGHCRIEDATWAVLAGELSEQQLMDVVFTVGAYDLLAMVFGAFEVPIDDDLLGR